MSNASVQETFFRVIFGKHSGIVALARINRATKEFTEDYIEYDFHNTKPFSEWCNKWSDYDLYYSPMLYSAKKRTKDNVSACVAAYADLDECNPENLLIEPTMILESSTGRYQALWVFEELVDPPTAEDLSRRIAYYHADQGADKSGWDLSQILRIPGTYNYKHKTTTGYDLVTLQPCAGDLIDIEALSNLYPQTKGYEYFDIPMPEEAELPSESTEEILERFKNRLMPTVYRLIQSEPDDDWSKDLWQLENLLYEAGLTREEAYKCCIDAKCNKYKRDGKPTTFLWKEICKAYAKRDAEYSVLKHPDSDSIPILSDDELIDASNVHTVVDEYIEWAKSIGDAAWQYHQASAFVVLSSLLAGYVKLPTSFGTFVPNLWFMILADTTLTRKTTAMDLGIDILTEIDPDAILATDGSVEGLFTALSMRPGRPSVFLRDEFSGFLDAMFKKDYMAGTAESLTKLYDGKYQKRILRKDTIEVKSPVLILYAGGIKTRVLSLLNYEHVASGFLPRFIFVTAESDVSRLQPLGPPTERSIGERDRIRNRFAAIASHYAQPAATGVVLGGKSVSAPRAWEAQLTPQAWARYNKIESDLLTQGLQSMQPDLLTPTFDRLAKSGLKVATLIAASRRLEDQVIVSEEDLIKAFSYVEFWRQFTIEILDNIGKSTGEHLISKVTNLIERNPGISRGEVMQRFHLSATETTRLFETMEQRNVIVRQRSGRGERLWTVK